jgi:4-diphosphocytidyl-2-C-methyl-D-erythritol kinase
VGPLRSDGKHELATVYQRIDLCDRITIEPAAKTLVRGFKGDTIVQGALAALAPTRQWRITIKKEIPLAAGLGGGSSDAATALRLANAQLDRPLPAAELHELAAKVGADVPFFLVDGPQLGQGDGAELEQLALPQDFIVLLLLPRGATKASTAAVYAAFDARAGATGFAARAAALRKSVASVTRPRDLASLPANDLASSPFADRLRALGAFRADVTGAGPVVYGLFTRRSEAQAAARALRGLGRTWITVPAWYG